MISERPLGGKTMSNENLPYVETFAAGEFVCDKCGKNTYFSLVNVEDELNQKELVDFYSKVQGKRPPKGTKAFWFMTPLIVTCKHCKAEYATFEQVMTEDDVEQSEL